MRILIIEDDLAVGKVLQDGLRAYIHQVVSADNGQGGVIATTDETVELVLLAFEELLARIHTVTRRSDQSELSQLRGANLCLDLLEHRAWRGDTLIDLTRREFTLLEYFMRHPQQVLSRQQILLAVWGCDSESNVVNVYVKYLRNKIDEPGKPSLITTVRGVGYRFEPPPPSPHGEF